jgi:hypothetical protein
MATRVIAAQDKAISGAGDDVQIKAGNANTSGAGGHIIIQPGAQVTTGGNGLVIVRQPSGVAGTDEIQLSHDGGKGSIINKDGVLQVGGSHIALRPTANNARGNMTAGVIYATDIASSDQINADGQTNDSYSWAIDYSGMNWGQGFNMRVGWSHIKGAANFGLIYGGDNTNGRRATLQLTDGSTGGGAWAYRSSTTTVNTSYNDLNLSGHSAFQRLNATAATIITGIAPASTAGGSGTPTWIHTDGRVFWLYNVGTFNITLKHDNASSTAGNRLLTETGGDLIIGPGRYAQLVYDGTSSRWRATGENYPYVFPTADGTNGQVLTTNGSGSLSWATVSAGATASGTTNYIAKFTGASTLGNSLIFDNGTNVGIGTATNLSDKVNIYETSAPIIRFQTSGNQYGARIGFWANNGMQIQCATANQPIIFYTANTSNDASFERMRIKHDGLIGINEASPGGLLQITTVAATKGLIVKGAASQSANLTEWQDSTGAVVASVSPTGAFFGSSYTSYGTVDSATQIFGNNYWTPNMTGGVTSPSAGTYTKSSGTTDWNAQVYSSEGYIKNVYCSAQASQTTGYIMFGLNSDPTTDAVYSSLDYAWYVQQGGVLAIWENNAQIATYGSYTTSTVLSITYDGTNVRYWKDGVLQRTVARSVGNPLYLDSSFHTLSSSLNSVQFGPIGQPFGISGTSGYLPKFTSQQTLGNSIVYDDGVDVGIGTTNPLGRLDVVGANTYEPIRAITNSASNLESGANATIGLSVNNSNTTAGNGIAVSFATATTNSTLYGVGAIGFNNLTHTTLGVPQGKFQIITRDSGGGLTQKLTIDTTGYVGIGTASPSNNLSIGAAAGKIGFQRGSGDGEYCTMGFKSTSGNDRYVFEINNTSGTGELRLNQGGTSTPIGMTFYTNNTERMRIDSSGNVGIGTTSPSFKLQVDAASVDANIVANVTSGYGGIGVYAAGTNKVVLGYAGANANYGSQTIAGDVVLKTNNTNFHINTGSGNSVTTAYFSSAGNVGIGNVSPGARLQVDTGATGTKGLLLKAAASQTANLLEVQNSAGTVLTNIDSGGNLTVATTTSAYTYYSTNTTTRWATGHDSSNGYFRIVDYVWDGTTRLMITPGGNVVLGNAGGDQTNGPKLLVTTGPDTTGGTGAARKGLIVRGSASQTANLQEWQNSSSAVLTYIDNNGRIVTSSGGGTVSTPDLYFNNGSSTSPVIKWNPIAGNPGFWFASGSSVVMKIYDNGTVEAANTIAVQDMYLRAWNIQRSTAGIISFNGSGPAISVGAGTLVTADSTLQVNVPAANKIGLVVAGASTQTGNLQEWRNNSGTALAYMDANGNFFAVSKSFLIDHPTPAKAAEGKKLRYASLEGPENGVYFRGTLTGDNEIVLPDYWKDLVDPESITVNLTPRKRPQPNLFVVDANAEKVTVESDREICCDFIVYGTRKDIAKLEVEIDGNSL